MYLASLWLHLHNNSDGESMESLLILKFPHLPFPPQISRLTVTQVISLKSVFSLYAALGI